MTSSGSEIIFLSQAGAVTSATFNVDNDRIVVLQVIGGAGTPVGQRLYVYGSIGIPGQEGTAINPLVASSTVNPYSEVMVRDLNSLEAIVGTDGIAITANSVNLYEINVNSVRDVHFKLTGSNVPVTAILRGYRHV